MAAPRPGSRSAGEILGGVLDETENALHLIVDSAAAQAAGENHLGAVGSPTAFVTSTITFSVGGAGATGDYMGTTTAPQSFAGVARVSGGKSVIKSICITDRLTTAAVALELWVFGATFTAPTDNAAWAITDAHRELCQGVIAIETGRWYADSNGKVYSDDRLGLVVAPTATALFYALVARGTTPAWATADVVLNLGVLQS